jgi:predicted GNAT family acetyltransferase
MSPDPLHFRFASDTDVALLAELNHVLIADEGHDNPMRVPELAARMRAWLAGEYRAVLFLREEDVVAYALYRSDEWHRVHVRQFLVVRHARRQGIGRQALALFRREVVPGKRVVLEVLTTNTVARAFYAACGFRDYAVTLSADPSE